VISVKIMASAVLFCTSSHCEEITKIIPEEKDEDDISMNVNLLFYMNKCKVTSMKDERSD
jgi:hypothetical protein